MSCNTSGMLLIFYYIKIAMNIIFIITPIILLVMCTIDLFGAVAGSKDSLSKAWQKIIKRIIVAVVILILPAIISVILGTTDIPNYNECLNKATKANIQMLEKEEKAKKELEEKKLSQIVANTLAKMKAVFDELSARIKEDNARRAEQAASTGSGSGSGSSTGTITDRDYTTSASATGMLNVAKAQMGNKGGQKYWSWWGYGSRQPWCAMFVSWVANENGLIDKGVIPKFQACRAGVAWFKNAGQWKGNSYSPKPGDIVFFDWDHNGVSDHVGIVEYVSNGKIHTIEGNVSDSVGRRTRTTGDILGYGIPKY